MILISLYPPFSQVVLHEEHHVTVNGKHVTLPHLVEKLVVQRLSNYVIIYGYSGITVQWDGHSGVYVHVSNDFRGKTCGLCGNFNGDPDDDFRALDGTPTTSVTRFANSFKMTQIDELCANVLEKDVNFPCGNLNVDQLKLVEEQCDAMLGASFAACHSTVNPSLFLKMCQEELCRCNSTAMTDCLCASLAQYSRACARKKIELTWRNELGKCCKYTGKVIDRIHKMATNFVFFHVHLHKLKLVVLCTINARFIPQIYEFSF